MTEYIKKSLMAREIRKLLRVRESAVDIFQAGFEFGVNLAWVKINKIPAADVAPVVHGHWIKTSLMFASSPTGRHGNVHACSNCGEQSGIGFKTPYCAICGAKMDEEGTNNDT